MSRYRATGTLVHRPRAEDKYVSALFAQDEDGDGVPASSSSPDRPRRASLFRDLDGALSRNPSTASLSGTYVESKKKTRKEKREELPVPVSLHALGGVEEPPRNRPSQEDKPVFRPDVKRAAELVRQPSATPKGLTMLSDDPRLPTRLPVEPEVIEEEQGGDGEDGRADEDGRTDVMSADNYVEAGPGPQGAVPAVATMDPAVNEVEMENEQIRRYQEHLDGNHTYGMEAGALDDYVVQGNLKWDRAGIVERIQGLYKGYPGEATVDSAKYCCPRFLACVPAPQIFSTYRMVLALLTALVLGSIFSALQLADVIYMSDDVHRVFTVIAKIGLNFLKMIYVPLLFTTMIVSVAKMYMAKHISDTAKSVAIGGTFGVTIVFGAIAAFNGMLWGNLVMRVWDSVDNIEAYEDYTGKWDYTPAEEGVFDTVFGDEGIIFTIVVNNLFVAFTDGNMVALLLIAYIFGRTSSFQPEKIRPVIIILEAIRDTILGSWPRKITPLLVMMSILASFITRPDFFDKVNSLWPFIIADLIAINFITLVIVPLALIVVGTSNPMSLCFSNFVPLATAVGTASSGAAYPLAQYACRVRKLLSEEVIDFSLPLLNVINKPGSITHVCVCITYHSIVQNKTIEWYYFLVAMLLTPVVTIGGASLPSSSLVTQVTVLGAVGLSSDSIYLIASVDWMLDRFRTLLNIWADIVVAKIVDKYFCLAQKNFLSAKKKELTKLNKDEGGDDLALALRGKQKAKAIDEASDDLPNDGQSSSDSSSQSGVTGLELSEKVGRKGRKHSLFD